MTYPTRHQAIDMFLDKYYHDARMYIHGFFVAKIAEKIAKQCGLDKEKAFVLGLLHDIGYDDTKPKQPDFHPRMGYNIMIDMGYADVAKICLTHSFPNKDFSTNNFCDEWISWAKDLIKDVEYNDYDKLIQLADMLTEVPSGICSFEHRIKDVGNRHNLPHEKLNTMLKNAQELKAFFDAKCGCDIYDLLEIVK